MIYQDYLNQHELQRYASAMNARAKRVKAKGILTADSLRDRIFESGGCCEWCGVDLVNQEFELDHVQSLSQQGHNTADNLVVACPDCNRRKSGKHPARFASEIYSETGHKTPLLDKILQRYDITLTTQRSLFDTDSTPMDTKIEHDDDSSAIPPYKWS
jgi:HNH endonuclease